VRTGPKGGRVVELCHDEPELEAWHYEDPTRPRILPFFIVDEHGRAVVPRERANRGLPL
jgi:hypothetical protein